MVTEKDVQLLEGKISTKKICDEPADLEINQNKIDPKGKEK